MENKKYCNSCQKDVAADSVFCEFCGKKIEDSLPQDKNGFQDVSPSTFVAGNLENELRHINNRIENIEVNVPLTKAVVGIFFVLEWFSYLFFIGQIILLGYSMYLGGEEILKTFDVQIAFGHEAAKEQLRFVSICQFVWFFWSAITLAVGIFFTIVRKQSLKVLRQDKIIKKIITHINDLIKHLKGSN
jgi:hypothetical protein